MGRDWRQLRRSPQRQNWQGLAEGGLAEGPVGMGPPR